MFAVAAAEQTFVGLGHTGKMHDRTIACMQPCTEREDNYLKLPVFGINFVLESAWRTTFDDHLFG
jgi:hypothetical protein